MPQVPIMGVHNFKTKVSIIVVYNITIKCVSTAFHPLLSLYDRQFLLPTNPILHLQLLYPSTSPVLVMTTLTYHMREPTLKTQVIQLTSTILTKQLWVMSRILNPFTCGTTPPKTSQISPYPFFLCHWFTKSSNLPMLMGWPSSSHLTIPIFLWKPMVAFWVLLPNTRH